MKDRIVRRNTSFEILNWKSSPFVAIVNVIIEIPLYKAENQPSSSLPDQRETAGPGSSSCWPGMIRDN